MKRALVLLVLVACAEPIGPEPDDGVTTGSTGAGGAGSGGGNAQALGYENGSRLRAKVFAGADGSRQFAGWHDTELDVDCYFSLMGDGSTRCIPVAESVSNVFADSGCAMPVVLTTCTTPSIYVRKPTQVGCTSETTMHSLGAEIANVYQGTPANCTVSSLTGYSFYSLGAALPSSTFVEAESVIE